MAVLDWAFEQRRHVRGVSGRRRAWTPVGVEEGGQRTAGGPSAVSGPLSLRRSLYHRGDLDDLDLAFLPL